MNNQKLHFQSVGNEYNKTYLKPDVKREMDRISEEIKNLEKKKYALSLFSGNAHYISDFNEIKSVNLIDKWIDARQYADGYSVTEEIYQLEVITDVEPFDVLIEYLGIEETYEQNVYYLHTPWIDSKFMDIVEEKVVELFEEDDNFKVIITNGYKNLNEALNEECKTAVCEKDYLRDNFLLSVEPEFGREKILKSGEMYKIFMDKHNALIKKDEAMVYLNEKDLESHFPSLKK